MMSVKLRVFIAFAVAITLAAGYWWWGHDRDRNGPFVLYGNVDIREVELAFRQPGRIVKMAFEEGATVKAGDVLAELDAQPYREVLAAADFERIERGSRPQEIAQAEATVLEAEARMPEAERQLERQTHLRDTDATSERALETARSARDQAQAALLNVRQNLSLRREGNRKEDIESARARLAAADTKLEQANTALTDTQLTAPADAIVSARVREAGSMLSAGQPVYTLSVQEPVYVRAFVTQTQLARVQPGSAVRVYADGAQQPLPGTVGFISPRAEFTPKTVETTALRTDLVYRIRIVMQPGALALRQGMPVTVRFES